MRTSKLSQQLTAWGQGISSRIRELPARVRVLPVWKKSAQLRQPAPALSHDEIDRRNLRTMMNSLVLHIHPARVPARALRFTYTWGLGGISGLLCLLLLITGALLMFRYEPDIDKAYLSIQVLESEVAFGSLIRGVHHWSANLLIITTFLHFLRVFYSGGFKSGRRLNFVIGMIILILVFFFNFTGYLLPWDQLAYWAITVSSSVIRYIPVIGRGLANALLGGPEVGQGALHNFYAIHVAVLPATTFALLAYHVWRIRRDGGISQPVTDSQVERVTTIPNLVRREAAVAAIVITALMLFSMFVPAPLESVADPLRSPNPAKAAWYFGWLQELLLHMETEAALLLLVILLGAVILLPVLDRRDQDVGVYFRSKIGRQAGLLGAVIALNVIPILIIADELWIDWMALLPGWPTLIANGFVPMTVVLALCVLVYLSARWLLKANNSEAQVALFAFIMLGLIILTVTCGFFRGANMDLVLPGSM